jgi:hypothetical protein
MQKGHASTAMIIANQDKPRCLAMMFSMSFSRSEVMLLPIPFESASGMALDYNPMRLIKLCRWRGTQAGTSIFCAGLRFLSGLAGSSAPASRGR